MDPQSFAMLANQQDTQVPQPRRRPRIASPVEAAPMMTQPIEQPQAQPPATQGIPETANEYIGNLFKPFEAITEPLAGALVGGAAKAIVPQYAPQIEAGARAGGKALPRMAVEAMLTGRRTGDVGPWYNSARRMIGFGDVGLKSYSETSPEAPMAERLGVAGLNTAAWGLAPMVGQKAVSKIAEPALKVIDPKAIHPLMQIAAKRGASMTGTLSAFELANLVSSEVQNQPYDLVSPEKVGSLAAMVLPFEAMGLYGDVKGMKQAKQNRELLAQKAAVKVNNTRQQVEGGEGEGKDEAKLSIESKATDFQSWFEGSKIVDDKGKPRVVYHGTTADFTQFDATAGIFFALNKEYPNYHLQVTHGLEQGETFPPKSRVIPAFVSLKNPAPSDVVIEAKQRLGHRDNLVVAELKSKGYDGWIDTTNDELAVFAPEQVKSAIGHKGSWSGPELSIEDSKDLSNLTNFGYDPTVLSKALDRFSVLPRLPGESMNDYTLRSLAAQGIDLSKSTDPFELYRGVHGLVFQRLRDIAGMDVTKAKSLADFATRFIARVGHTQKEMRVLDASNEASNAVISFISPPTDFSAPFIGVDRAGNRSPDAVLFRTLTTVVHELYHGMVKQALFGQFPENTSGDHIRAMQKLLEHQASLNLSQTEKVTSMEQLLRSMTPTITQTHRKMLEARAGHWKDNEEYLADMFKLVALGGTMSKTSTAFRAVEDLLKFGNVEFGEVVSSLLRDVGYTLDGTIAFLEKQLGWMPTSTDVIRDIVGNMRQLVKSAEYGKEATEAFLKMMDIREANAAAPVPRISYRELRALQNRISGNKDALDEEIHKLIDEASPLVVPQELTAKDKAKLPIHLSFIDHFIALPQFIRKYSEFADAARLARAYQGVVKECVMDAWQQFIDKDTGKYDVTGMIRLMTPGSAENKAFNAVTLRQNEFGGEEFGRLARPEELAKIPAYAALTSDQKLFVDDMISRTSSANMIMARHLVESQFKKTANRVARAWMSNDRTLQHDKAKDLGEALTYQYLDADRLGADPTTDPVLHESVARGRLLLEEYRAKNPQVLRRMEEIFTTDAKGEQIVDGKVSPLVQEYRNYREQLRGKWLPPNPKAEPGDTDASWHFEGRPGYTSEVRIGNFLLTWGTKVPGQKEVTPHLVGIKTRKEYERRWLELKKKFDADRLLPADQREYEYFHGVDRATEKDNLAGLRPDLFKTYNAAITSLNNRIMMAVRREHPEADEFLRELQDELNPAGEMVKLLEAPWMKERTLYGGREELNMAEGVAHYINSVAYTIAKRELRDQQQLYLLDPKMREQPELQSIARRFFNEIMDPTEKGYAGIKALVAFNYIFFSPSLAVIEFTQQLTNHIPALVANGMGVGEAFGGLKRANLDFFEATKRGVMEKAGRNVYKNSEETEMIERAKKYGIIDAGWLQEFFHLEDDVPFLNARNVFAGTGNVFDRQGLIGMPLYHMYKLGVRFHSLAINMNTEVAFLSAYRHFRKTNEPEIAFKLADDLSHESMHGGGRASRPLWYLGIGPGTPGATVGGIMFILQSYVYNTIAQQARYLKQTIKNTQLNPGELSAAHKAAGLALMAQVTLAGMMGIPFTSQTIALIEQFFPDAEPRKKIREMFFGAGEWVNSKLHLAGQDSKMGMFMADAGMDGIANSIPGGLNISNRFELGGFLGVDPYRGFSWRNVVGPGAAMFEQLLTRASEVPEAIRKGDYLSAGASMVPNANLQRVHKLATDGWNVRNRDERLNVDLTHTEAAFHALGLTPKRLATFRALNEMKKRADTAHSLKARRFHSDMADLVVNGKQAQVTDALLARARTEEGYDPREGARRIAELVQLKTEPFDPMRTGAKGEGSQIVGRLYPSSAVGTPSETEMLTRRLGLVQQLGFQGKPTKTEFRVAQLVDQMMQANPMMSRTEAKAAVEFRMNPRRSMMWGGPDPAAQGMGQVGSVGLR